MIRNWNYLLLIYIIDLATRGMGRGSKMCGGFSRFTDFMDSNSSCLCRLAWRGCPSGIKMKNHLKF